MKPLKFIISGGGTGGHIFPAIAIANALKAMHPDCEILFVGANGRMEMEKVPAAGYKIIGLDIAGLQRDLSLENLSFPVKLVRSLIKAQNVLQDFKPDAVVGVGGYASGPLLFAATRKKIPALIQEQNSYAGITNKLLGRRVQKVCVAYEGMDQFFPANKIIFTGNPVRQDILTIDTKREEALKFFGLSSDRKTVLVIGGSLGARTINKSIEKLIPSFAEKNVQLIWQCGKGFYSIAQEATKNSIAQGIKSFDFITKMDLAYAAADIIVSRAGASSISEICLVKKPAILIPSPNVAEDHQTKNAMALVNKNAAILVSDIDADQQLGTVLFELLNDEQKQKTIAENAGKLAMTGSAEKIANEVTKLIAK